MDRKQTTALKKIIESNDSFLLLTHTEVDHDAVCSLLLLKHILEKYFDKNPVTAVVQEETWPQFKSLDLPGIDGIVNLPSSASVESSSYDIVFILDVPYLKRCPNTEGALDKAVERLIIIDHHETEPEENALYINDKLSSTAEQIYTTFKETVHGLVEDGIVAELVQIGILGDTDRFIHGDILTPDTFRTFGDLYEHHPINIERIFYKMTTYSRKCMDLLCHILGNIRYSDNMAYSFIDSTFAGKNGCSFNDVHLAKGLFTKNLLRSLEGVDWGFLVYKMDDSDTWKISFRATEGTVKVIEYAQKLGGGGHEYAAGADIEAPDAKTAVEKVLGIMRIP